MITSIAGSRNIMDPSGSSTTTIRPQTLVSADTTLVNSSATSKNIPNGTSNSNASNSAKMPKPPLPPAAPVAPRFDMQPYYEALKSDLSKLQWMAYTDALNKFMSGKLNDEELRGQIGDFIKGQRIRQHNQLLSAVIANMMRDSPPAEVAVWVSASDKPCSVSKMPAGDVNERRLKKEVMAISARERRRIKEVQDSTDDIENMLGNMLQEYHLTKQVKKPPEIPPSRSATLSKTNWESEIKQRYTLPLASETGEFPDVEAIRLRLLPICYEEGVPGGLTPDTAAFMNVAAETFVKEVLSTIISRVRSNSLKYVQTDKYRKLAPRNRWTPQERPLLGMHDVRLSLTLGDNYLTQLPLCAKKIMAGGWFERDYEVDPDQQFIDDSDVGGWVGASRDDRRELKGLLDDCLANGS